MICEINPAGPKMIRTISYWLFVLLLLGFVNVELVLAVVCPEKCTCRPITENTSGLKVKCGGSAVTKVSSLKDIEFHDIRSEIVQL